MNHPIEEGILKLLDRFSYGLTIEDVSSKLGISRPTASKYLFGLGKEGKISVRMIGKYRLHYPKSMKLEKKKKGSLGIMPLLFILLLLVSMALASVLIKTPNACNDSDGNCNFNNILSAEGTEESVDISAAPFGWLNATVFSGSIPSGHAIDNITLTVMWRTGVLDVGANNIFIGYNNSTGFVECAGPFGYQVSAINTTCDLTLNLTIDDANNLKIRVRGQGLPTETLFVDYIELNVTYHPCNVLVKETNGCYETVQEAINSASGYQTVLIINSTEYNESIVVNRTGLTLTSNTSIFPTIFSDSPNLVPFNATVNITKAIHNVTITKLAIKYNGTAPFTQAIASRSVNNITIRNLTAETLRGTRDNYGIYFFNVTNSTIDNVTVITNGTGPNDNGIYLFSFSLRNNVTRSVITTNGTSGGNGIVLSSSSNFNNISSNSIQTSGSLGQNMGIQILIASGNTVVSNSIRTAGTGNNHGVFLQSGSSSNNIESNIISTSGSLNGNMGISLSPGSSNNVVGNIINTYGPSLNHGIILQSGSNSNTFISNSIYANGTSSQNMGIRVDLGSNNNYFLSNNITTNTSVSPSNYGIYISVSENNTFVDSFINAAFSYDVFLNGSHETKNNYFVNVSFNKSDINATAASVRTKLFVQYRADVYVVDGNGNQLSSATVFGNDSSVPNDENPTSNFSVLTNSSGQIAMQILTEFLANGTYQNGNYIYFTNYTINASKTGYAQNSTKINLTESRNITLTLTAIGTLVVTLETPDPLNAAQNQTFFVNATIKCRNGPCGNVQSFLRYNSSGNDPNDKISSVMGASPFWVNTTNPSSCASNPLEDGEFCNVTWNVNATGAIGSVWSIGSNFSSDDLNVASNHTTNSTATIIPCFVFLDTFSSVDFGSLYPRTQNNSAPGNSGKLYNISSSANMTCNANFYIKGLDLEQTGGSRKIGIGNLTWNTTNPVSRQVAYDYELLATNVPPSLNITTYYWLTVPGGVSSSTYSGNITILANWSGQA